MTQKTFSFSASAMGALAVSASLLVAGCDIPTSESAQTPSGPVAVLVDASVTRVDDSLKVHWRGTPGAVDVFVASSPEAPESEWKLVSAADTDGEHLQPLDTTGRQYFHLRPVGGDKGLWAAARVLPLEGGLNFRDLGGYETSTGKHVRWGKIFRSGTMGSLSEADYRYLGSLGIRAICDLRSARERASEPTRWQSLGENVDYKTWNEDSGGRLIRSFAKLRTAEDARAALIERYRESAYDHKDYYAGVFEELIAGHAPLVFSGPDGKDWAGRAAALVLAALDVPRETIIEDYAFSEQAADLQAYAAHNASLSALPEPVRSVLMRAEPDYIAAMLDRIERDHGSVLAFIQTELGVDDQKLARLRELYLEG